MNKTIEIPKFKLEINKELQDYYCNLSIDCNEIKCNNCIFDIRNMEEFRKWYANNRENKLERILNKTHEK